MKKYIKHEKGYHCFMCGYNNAVDCKAAVKAGQSTIKCKSCGCCTRSEYDLDYSLVEVR